jgi:hypothetical protein
MSHLNISYFTYESFGRINDVPDTKIVSRRRFEMFIDTRAIGFPLTEAIVRHVETKLESALGPFSRWILKITVRLDDVRVMFDFARLTQLEGLEPSTFGSVVAQGIKNPLFCFRQV